jgi:indolepyruvate ferredoxin oxidoreductase beta subunit
VKETIEGLGAKLVMIDALGLAKGAGSHLTVNVVMVGALTAAPGFPLGEDEMREGMKLVVPPKKVEMNMMAFDSGLITCVECLD